MDYACELEQKKRRVQDALSRIGGVEFPDLQITGSRSVYGYRNKVQFPVQAQNGKPVAGFYRAGQPCGHCQSRTAKFSRKAPIGRAKRCFRWMEKENIAAYDERTHTGVVRHIYLRRGKQGPRRFCFALIVKRKDACQKKRRLSGTIPASRVPEVSGNCRQLQHEKEQRHSRRPL